MKKTNRKNTLAKALLITLSILGLTFSLGHNTLSAKAAEDSSAFENLDPNTEPDDMML